jgi:hypothetical protein
VRGVASSLQPAVLRRGVAAGLAGTVARVAVERAGGSIAGRPPRATPGLVGARLLRLDAPDPATRALLGAAVHWGHGAGAGVVRALLAARGMRGAGASALHCLVMWAGDAAVLRALGIAPPPWRWPVGDLLADALDKAVFTTVVGAVVDTLAARGR